MKIQERAIAIAIAMAMTTRDDHCSIQCIAKRLRRSSRKISRELHRIGGDVYDSSRAHLQSQVRLVAPRRIRTMYPEGTLFLAVRL